MKPTDDKLHEECGVIGILSKGNLNTSHMAYFGLIGLQHRGQESAGIAVNNDSVITYFKDMGLVQDVFDERIMSLLKGDMAIGHVRYSTCGDSQERNAQPIFVKYEGGNLAVAHNGNLINAEALKEELLAMGKIFKTNSDTEVIGHLLALHIHKGLRKAIEIVMDRVEGAYALTILTKEELAAVRDPYALRPLCVGETPDGYVFASESVALDLLGATFLKDLAPGEILITDRTKKLQSSIYAMGKSRASCVFEYVYFARPDSVMDGIGVYGARVEMGKILAKEAPADADVVICVPDSGTPAAHGYAMASGLPYVMGLIKNRYIGRTFIQPKKEMRELNVRLKLNPMRSAIQGKRVVMVDDSIVRGTTSRRIVAMLREAGAKEVHVRVSSPMVKDSCYFGIDTPDKKELIGFIESPEAIAKRIGADSVRYLSIQGMLSAMGSQEGFCTACFDSRYPMPVTEEYKRRTAQKSH